MRRMHRADHNRAVRSCLLAVSRAAGKEIVTLEGLGSPENPHPVQEAFIGEQAFQCGYCLNGWVLTAKALLHKNPHPTEAEMRRAFESLVCRCGSHVGIFSAVRKAARATKRSA
ncbi:MAG: 2Fe-2S iron-sulfur cluster-binding protein [Candidatus Acidiferrales bacterium]